MLPNLKTLLLIVQFLLAIALVRPVTLLLQDLDHVVVPVDDVGPMSHLTHMAVSVIVLGVTILLALEDPGGLLHLSNLVLRKHRFRLLGSVWFLKQLPPRPQIPA
jgi:hypothetical protein